MNEIGQRTGLTTSGTAFPNLPSWFWGYDSLGQVTSADSSVATNDRSYQYDSIGNRKKTANSLTLPISDNYTSNALNQYSAIQEGGTGVSPVYDDDGNATAYPLPVAPNTNSTLAWDAENRMISSTVGSVTTTYAYDALSRRIAKSTGSTSALYVYDSWNCIAEYSGSVGVPPALQKTRLWGLDLSGTLQGAGAGGVGGLLAESSLITSNPITFNTSYPTYDGNGNVSEYLDSTGQATAHFEYDPFGNTVVNTDTNNLFAYRFSTKPLDLETRLYYYGYRYYDPATGRWLSRDPIGEIGGINLYSFLDNGVIGLVDMLGLKEMTEEECEKLLKEIEDNEKVLDDLNKEIKQKTKAQTNTRDNLMTTLAAIKAAEGRMRENSGWGKLAVDSVLVGGSIALGAATSGLSFALGGASFMKSGYDLASYNDDFGAAKLQAEANELGKDWKEQTDEIEDMQNTIDSINDLLEDLNEKYNKGCPPCKDKA